MQYGPSHRLLISGQNFNCGFACIAHFLQEQLELPTLPPVFDEGPYQALLEAFRTVYQDPSLDWNDIKQSLDHYSHPGDKGMVWSLPLRHYLKNKLLSHTQYRDDLFSEFQALVDALLEGCTLSECRTDYSNLIDSNLVYLQSIVTQRTNMQADPLDPTQLATYWKETAYPNYCTYLGEGKNGSTPMITSTELSILCEFLHLKLEVYSPKQGGEEIDYTTIQGQTRGYAGENPLGLLVVSNSGFHWQRLLVDMSKVDSHNRDFEQLPSELMTQATPAAVLQKIFQTLRPNETPLNTLPSQLEVGLELKVDTFEASSSNEAKLQIEMEDNLLGQLLTHYQAQSSQAMFSYIQEMTLAAMQKLGYQKTDPKTRLAFEEAQIYIYTVNVLGLKNLIEKHPGIVQAIDRDGNTLLHHVALAPSKIIQLSFNFEAHYNALLKDTNCTLTVEALLKEIRSPAKAISRKKIEGFLEVLCSKAIDQSAVKNLSKDIDHILALKQNLAEIINHKESKFFDNITTATNKILRLLLDANADVNAKNSVLATPLHFMALYENKLSGSKEKSQACQLIDKGALSSPDVAGFTPLHFAATTNNFALINALLNAKVYVDLVSQHGLTALHLAALTGQTEAFKLLISRGARLDHKAYPRALEQLQFLMPAKHSTPLDFALERRDSEILDFVIDYLHDKSNKSVLKTVRSSGDVGLLHFYAGRGDLARFETLLTIGCDPRSMDVNGYMPLHIAALFGHEKIIELILAHQKITKSRWVLYPFNIDQKTSDGKTAWLLAKEQKDKLEEAADQQKFQKIMDMLQKEGAKQLKAPYSKGVLSTLYGFATRQSQFSSTLENTKTYQLLNDYRFIFSLLGHVSGGVVGMTLQGIRLAAVYAPSWIKVGGHKFYYTAKPLLHNKAHWSVQEGFDKVALASSWGLWSFMKAIQVADCITYPVRHLSGKATSHLFGNLSCYATSNQEFQALSYFIGQNVGHILVDSFNFSPKEEGAFDYELNKGLTLWSSLIGKRSGEDLVYLTHTLTRCLDPIYEEVGMLEHHAVNLAAAQVENVQGILSSLESYQVLRDISNNAKEILSPYQTYVTPIGNVISEGLKLKSEYNAWRDKLVQDIEGWLNNTILPEGKARDYANWYLQRTQVLLMTHKAKEAENDATNAELLAQEREEAYTRDQEEEARLLADPNATDFEIKAAQEKSDSAKIAAENSRNAALVSQQTHDLLKEQLTALEESTQILWEKTPKGIYEAEFKLAQENALDARMEHERAKLVLEQLEKHQAAPEEITTAQEKLKETQETLKKQMDELALAEKDIERVLTSLEKEKLQKDRVKNDALLEEKIEKWKNDTNEIYLNKDLYLEAENEEFLAKNQLMQDEYDYKVAQQLYDENHQKLTAFESLPDLTEADIKKLIHHAMASNVTTSINYLYCCKRHYRSARC